MSDESTTPDLVELTRLILEAIAGGDLDTVMSFFDANAVWETRRLGTTFEGPAAIRGFLEDWMAAYDDLELDVEEFRELGNGIALVGYVQTGRRLDITGHVRNRFAHVTTWVDGVVVKVAGYQDLDEARAAAERLAEERE